MSVASFNTYNNVDAVFIPYEYEGQKQNKTTFNLKAKSEKSHDSQKKVADLYSERNPQFQRQKELTDSESSHTFSDIETDLWVTESPPSSPLSQPRRHSESSTPKKIRKLVRTPSLEKLSHLAKKNWKCSNCHLEESDKKMQGPNGKDTLCERCGLLFEKSFPRPGAVCMPPVLNSRHLHNPSSSVHIPTHFPLYYLPFHTNPTLAHPPMPSLPATRISPVPQFFSLPVSDISFHSPLPQKNHFADSPRVQSDSEVHSSIKFIVEDVKKKIDTKGAHSLKVYVDWKCVSCGTKETVERRSSKVFGRLALCNPCGIKQRKREISEEEKLSSAEKSMADSAASHIS